MFGFSWFAAAISSALARHAAANALRIGGAPSNLAGTALEVLMGWEGKGEEGGNNRGPWIEKWSGKKKANWCAAIIGAAYKEAAIRCEMPLPFELSLGAKRLGRNIGEAGSFVEIDSLIAGDVIVLHRGPRGSWKGHIRMFHSYDIADPNLLHYWAGNEGRFPAKCGPGTMSLDTRDVVFCARAPGNVVPIGQRT